ncbi:MAG: BLUF domain-containing protein [Oceanicaulis sp.]
MFLSRAVYVSRPRFTVRPPVLEGELLRIANAGLSHNPRDGITGVLAIDSEVFIQALEGERGVVSRTLARIVADPRHNELEIADISEIGERAFEDWAVAFADLEALPLSDARRVDHRTQPAEALLERLLRIRKTGVVACRSVALGSRAAPSSQAARI